MQHLHIDVNRLTCSTSHLFRYELQHLKSFKTYAKYGLYGLSYYPEEVGIFGLQ